MISLSLFIIVAAVVCWILATFNAASKFNLIAAKACTVWNRLSDWQLSVRLHPK
jgi:hypothetical protein